MNSLITFELCGYHSSHNSIQSFFELSMSVVSFIQSSLLKTFRFVQLFGLLADCSSQFKKKRNGVSSDSPDSHIGEAETQFPLHVS